MRTSAGAACAAAAALALSACGGDDGVSGPSEVMPADTPFYLDVSIRPQGEAAEGAEAAAAKLLDTDDPGTRIIELIEQAAAEEGERFDYEHDVEPWLGERVGFFAPNLEDDSDAVLVVETSDPEAALDFARLAGHTAEGQREREYNGQSFQIDDEGDAFGLIDDFLVLGDVQGFRQAVDAVEDEDTLSGSGAFQDGIGELPEDRLASLYVDPQTFIEAVPTDDPDDETGKDVIQDALGDAGEEPVLGSATASAEGIELELSAGGGGEVETPTSSLLEQLPSDAWLALGVSDLGGKVEAGIEAAEDAGIPGISAETIEEQVRGLTSIDLRRQVIEALGDLGLFVSGTSEAQLGGALVVESKDPAASADLVRDLQALIREQGGGLQVRPLASADGAQGFELNDPSDELPKPIRVFQREDRIVAGYGPAGERVLEGGETLGANPTYQAAQQRLGEIGVDLYLEVAPILRLAESEGANSDPDYRQAKPYLDGLSYLVVGSGSDGERALLEILLGIK